ncbi:hypothetical protein BH23GEM10_BH23GEM10_00170 [soil metagenome]
MITTTHVAEPARPKAPAAPVLRRCACGGSAAPGQECEACRRKRLQRWAAGPAPAVAPPSVNAVLASPGRPLEANVRARMESRLGHDFGGVRVHDDARADDAARDVGALAWAYGSRIAFAAGQYRPGTGAGDRLLAHELAHTLQCPAAPVGGTIEVGSANDAAEQEADRIADGARSPRGTTPNAAAATGRASHRRAPILRRQLDPALEAELPESVRRSQMVVIPLGEGPPAVHLDVIRTFERCPCRDVPEARDGVFYDIDRNRVAIAYRHCEGRTTTDVYAEAEGDPQRVLSGQQPVSGARIGVEINVAPRRGEGGRILLEGVGADLDSAPAAGGNVLLVYEGGGWRVFADAQYRRRLGELNEGQIPDQVDVSLGGQWGRVRARLQLGDLASESRSVTLQTCLDIGIGNAQLCGTIGTGGSSGTTGTIGVQIPFDLPGRPREERCHQCYCPPARPVYECHRYTFPWIEDVPRTIDVEESHEFRYYFRLDRDSPSEDGALRAQSDASLAALQDRVEHGGGAILDIAGYTSPEAGERHNEQLSERRGERRRSLLTVRLGGSVTVPESRGAGELLGRRPTPSTSSRLNDIITEHGFRRAEDLTFLLLGEEIPNRELADQFLSLFGALTEPADRLALFGLTDNDAIAPRVLATVDQFVASRGRGPRPWERVFRLLRVAVARVAWTEQRDMVEQVHRGSSRVPVTGAECERYAQQAEAEKRFPRIDPRHLIGRVDRNDRNAECRERPTGREPDGCDYRVPAVLRRPTAPTAPARAPRRLF